MALSPSKMMRFHFPRSMKIGLVAGCGLLILACGGSDESERPAAIVPAVEAVQARSGALPLRERVSGTVRAENQVAIRAEIDAPIVEVYVRSGDTVERGEPLVRLDDRQLRDQLRQAQASVRISEAAAAESDARVAELQGQLSRTRRLAEQQLVSVADLEALEAQVGGARASAREAVARIEQARATEQERQSELARTLVRAPVSGRVGQRNAEVGMIARSDTILFQLGDPDDLVVEVPLTQEMLRHVRSGNPAIVSSPALGGAPVEATLARVSPFLQAGSFSTTGEVDVENRDGRLTPGMFVTVDILHGESRQSILVPTSAIYEDPATGSLGVWIVESMGTSAPPAEMTKEVPEKSERVALRPVEVLAQSGGTAGISGVREGEWVVIVGQHLLAQQKEPVARVRPTSWERVVRLQERQRDDLIHGYLEKQQQYARASGAEPPSSSRYLAAAPAGTETSR